jgi:hypothetical protein
MLLVNNENVQLILRSICVTMGGWNYLNNFDMFKHLYKCVKIQGLHDILNIIFPIYKCQNII